MKEKSLDFLQNTKCNVLLMLFAFAYLLSCYFLLKFSIFDVGSLQGVYGVGLEGTGIYIGAFISFLVWLYIYIVYWWQGLKKIVQFTWLKMYVSTIVLSAVCSILFPLFSYFLLGHTIYYSFLNLFCTFLLNSFIITICSPLLNLVVFAFVILVSSFVSQGIYRFYNFWKSKSFSKCSYWKNLEKYMTKEDKKIKKIVLTPHQIEFYLKKKEVDKTVKLSKNGLYPVEQFALCNHILKFLTNSYETTDTKWDKENYIITLEAINKRKNA